MVGILDRAAIANLGKAPQACGRQEGMFVLARTLDLWQSGFTCPLLALRVVPFDQGTELNSAHVLRVFMRARNSALRVVPLAFLESSCRHWRHIYCIVLSLLIAILRLTT